MTMDRIQSILSILQNTPAMILAVLLSTTQPAHSDSVNHWPEPIAQDFLEGEKIQDLLKLEILGIPSWEFIYYMDPESLLYYVNTLKKPKYGILTWKIINSIRDETGIVLGWLDIPNFADLVIARQSWDTIWWRQAYDFIMELYPAYRGEFSLILTKLWLNPHGELA